MAECPGVYRLSSMRDGGLARIRIPGGRLTADQLRTVADLAATCGNGQIDLTNRANLQIRGLHPDNAQQVAETLRTAGLLCADPDADRIRNITASPLAGIDNTEIVDVTPLVTQLDTALQNTPQSRCLSPKFAFVIDGGGRSNLADIGHDIGFSATRTPGRFSISLAGNMTARAIAATELVAFSQAAIEHITRSGHTRMKDTLADSDANQLLEEIARVASITLATETPITPEALALPYGRHNGRDTNASWYCLGVSLARLSVEQAHGLANMSNLGDATLRLTPWQSIVLPRVGTAAAEEIEHLAHRHGFLTTTPPVHIVACAGCTGCERTEADTKADGRILIDAFAAMAPSTQRPPTIHLSGCSRGCAHPGASDVLVLANEGSANYTIHAGSRPSRVGSEAPIKTGVSSDMLAASVAELVNSE